MQPKNIIALLALLSALFRHELGLDTYLSDTLATGAIGAILFYFGYAHHAKSLLRPKSLDVLGDLELYIEKRYAISIPDELKGEIVGLVYGMDTDAE